MPNVPLASGIEEFCQKEAEYVYIIFSFKTLIIFQFLTPEICSDFT